MNTGEIKSQNKQTEPDCQINVYILPNRPPPPDIQVKMNKLLKRGLGFVKIAEFYFSDTYCIYKIIPK